MKQAKARGWTKSFDQTFYCWELKRPWEGETTFIVFLLQEDLLDPAPARHFGEGSLWRSTNPEKYHVKDDIWYEGV